MLHGLERANRHAVLAPHGRVLAREPDRAAHHSDQVGGGERESERRPAGELLVAESVGAERRDLNRAVEHDRGTGEVRPDRGAGERHGAEHICLDEECTVSARRVDRHRSRNGGGRATEIGGEGHRLGGRSRRRPPQSAQVGREGRPEVRGVGEAPCELFGDDRDLHRGGPGASVVGGGAQLAPLRTGDRRVELGGAVVVVEPADRVGRESIDHLGRRIAQVLLLG